MEKNYNSLSIPLALFILYIYGFYGIPLLMILIPLCQDITHKCPDCGEILLTDKYCNVKLQDSNVKKIIRKLFFFK
jgi:hypothetical protein